MAAYPHRLKDKPPAYEAENPGSSPGEGSKNTWGPWQMGMQLFVIQYPEDNVGSNPIGPTKMKR